MAQDVPADSLREYELGEIVVGGEAEVAASTATLQRIGLAEVDRLDAASVAGAARLIPAAHLQTNSRGETLLYLRGAGERQVALFWDGALLNVPWDNRVDLGLVPSGVVGGMTVAKGVPSMLWGPNVLGGAVNLVSRGLDGDGAYTETVTQAGTAGFAEARALGLGRRGPLGYAAALGYARRDGLPLPDDLNDARLRFSQPDSALRTNTDLMLGHAFGRLTYDFSERSRLGLSALHLEGEKGVAPEGHLDPAVDRVRFWRYPVWRTTLAVLSGEAGAGPLGVRGALWASRFRQTIDAFNGAEYERVEGAQDDEDVTFGGRVVGERAAEALTLRLALNGLLSTHRQQDFEVTARGARDGDPELTYRQLTGSVGAEAEARPLDRLTLSAGLSLDALATPRTGDKPGRDPFVDWGATAGVAYGFGPDWTARASLGRKARFPTLRELFGESLGRFALNPGLRPESAWLAEAGVERRGDALSGEAVLFFTRTDDTLDRETLEDGRRRRVNLGGSRVAGVEVSGAARALPGVRLDGHLTLMRVRATAEDGAETFLAEKPETIGRLAATTSPGRGVTATVEGVYTGRAFSPDGPDSFERLPASLVLNARLGYRFGLPLGVAAEAFARVDNVADAVVLPQLGLPGPGREVRGGLKLAL